MTQEWSQVAYHRYSKRVVDIMIRMGLTPNAVTVFNHALTLTAGVWAFSRGVWWGNLLGLAVCLINGFLDYADGDIAKRTGKCSKVGEWLDTGFDVVIQNAIMGAICLGCYKGGFPAVGLVWFFIGNASLNLVSFKFNEVFGFHSKIGNEAFRAFMLEKPTWFNRAMMNLIDPTASFAGLVLFTVRYWLTLGAILNCMTLAVIVITVLSNIRWFIMFCLFALHQNETGSLHVLHVLAKLDDDRKERYER